MRAPGRNREDGLIFVRRDPNDPRFEVCPGIRSRVEV
jgi:hypothetical protein